MENGFVLEVSELKIGFTLGKVIQNHLVVVVCNCVMDREVTIVVLRIQFGFDVLNDIGFAFHADNVLYRLTLVVLLASGSEEVVRSLEPVENGDLALSGAHEQHVLTQAVLDNDSFSFLILKDV